MLWSATAVGNLIYAAARDVTERLQAEAAMRRNGGDWHASFTTICRSVWRF